MGTIWKYPVPNHGAFELMMPWGSRVLTVQMQQSAPYLWALVHVSHVKRPYQFRVFGTGEPVDLGQFAVYVGTWQEAYGNLVFHLFAEGRVDGDPDAR